MASVIYRQAQFDLKCMQSSCLVIGYWNGNISFGFKLRCMRIQFAWKLEADFGMTELFSQGCLCGGVMLRTEER